MNPQRFRTTQPGHFRARKKPGEMNKLEARYSRLLDLERAAGRIVDWHYEAVKFRLARLCFLTPDFLVIYPDGRREMHDVKGFMEDDALVKIKVAAQLYQDFRFVAVTRRKSEWKYQRFELADGLEIVWLKDEARPKGASEALRRRGGNVIQPVADRQMNLLA